MIFDFLKNFITNRKEDVQDHILGTSILDRFLRFFGTIAVLILGYLAIINIPKWFSNGGNTISWLLPVILLLILLDLFVFKTILPFIWSLITSVIGMVVSLLSDMFIMIIEVIIDILTGFFTLLIDVLSGIFLIFLGGGKNSS